MAVHFNSERYLTLNSHHSNERGILMSAWDAYRNFNPQPSRDQMPEVDLVLRVLQIPEPANTVN